LAIAKRHVRAAVQRNRIKRLIRESFRHSRAALAGLDLVVMARPGLVDRNNRELSDSLRRHWNRLGDVSRA
jgi:ribonuclease P protein component